MVVDGGRALLSNDLLKLLTIAELCKIRELNIQIIDDLFASEIQQRRIHIWKSLNVIVNE